MLKKMKLRAKSPGEWARVVVPDWDCWKQPGECVKPGDLADVCVVPRLNHATLIRDRFEWHYSVQFMRAGSDYVRGEHYNDHRVSTHDFGLINTDLSGPNWDEATYRLHHEGKGKWLYEPASATIPSSARVGTGRGTSARSAGSS